MDDLKHSKDNVLIVSQQFFPSPIGVSPYITDLARWFREKGFVMRMITERPYYPHYRILDDYQRGQKDHESFFWHPSKAASYVYTKAGAACRPAAQRVPVYDAGLRAHYFRPC
jgi:hypothetical protein